MKIKVFCDIGSLGKDPRFDLYVKTCTEVFAEEGYTVRVFPFYGRHDFSGLCEDTFSDLLLETWERYVSDESWKTNTWERTRIRNKRRK